MSNGSFGVLAFSGLVGTVGALIAFSPSTIPRLTNAYWALFRMKSRLAEEDYDKLPVRITGVIFLAVAVFVLIDRWAGIWK